MRRCRSQPAGLSDPQGAQITKRYLVRQHRPPARVDPETRLVPFGVALADGITRAEPLITSRREAVVPTFPSRSRTAASSVRARTSARPTSATSPTANDEFLASRGAPTCLSSSRSTAISVRARASEHNGQCYMFGQDHLFVCPGCSHLPE